MALENAKKENKMKNKYLSFAKNAAIATGAAVGVGVGASELAEHFTDSSKIIGCISTLSQYTSWWASFLPLQAWDNRDIYYKNGKFDFKGFFYDNAKYATSSFLVDVASIATRPFLQSHFIDNGASPPYSSLLADSILIPARAGIAVVLARLTGVIKPNGSKNAGNIGNETLEKEVERDVEAVLEQGGGK